MKRATVRLIAVYIDCPHCGEGNTNRDGSLMWEPHQMPLGPSQLECFHCEKRFTMPVSVDVRSGWATRAPRR